MFIAYLRIAKYFLPNTSTTFIRTNKKRKTRTDSSLHETRSLLIPTFDYTILGAVLKMLITAPESTLHTYLSRNLKYKTDSFPIQYRRIPVTASLVRRFDKRRRKQTGFAGTLVGAFVPAVIPLFVHQHDVPDAEFQLVLAVRRVGHDAFESFPDRLRVRLGLGWRPIHVGDDG